MKKRYFLLIAFLSAFNGFSQTEPCGSVINDTFDQTETTLPTGWTEYNTSGRVTVNSGNLKFDHNTTQPSVYREFEPTSDDFSFSFDVSASRNSVNCQIDLLSSTGKYLATIAVGVGAASMKYATTLDGGIPGGFTEGLHEGGFTTNTVFSISTRVNFTEQTIDFYHAGKLMLENIPFLETATDVAKIDIQLLYMYANNGQFYFDNIFLNTSSENRSLLLNTVSSAETSFSSIIIGDKYGQYPQTAADTFQAAIANANAVLTDCDATSASIDQIMVDFEAAKETFEATQVNDPVLKIYSEYNFSGEEHEMYAGYYNGTLGAYDDWVVSFTLEKGYMVTFAENIDGTGASNVYIAAENDLQINLPQNLQNKASFIRLGPWFDVHKKGMAGKGTDVITEYNNSWHYNWSTTGDDVGDAKFVPNQWSGGSLSNAQSLGNKMNIAHYMAFNEPDGADQANMTVDTAIDKYKSMLASGLRLGSPANKDNAKGGVWRDEFMTKAEAAGLRVDFMVVHYYKKTTPQNFYNWLKAIHDKWQRPIWIKEFNYGAIWTGQPASNVAAGNGLISYMNMLDDTDFVERYSVFTWQPNEPVYSLMSVRNPVTLSESGVMYKNHVSPIAYQQEVYEQGQPLSIDSNSISSKFSIYPTIIKDGILNVNSSEDIKSNNAELTIYNLMGQQVQKEININAQVNVGTLSNGLYLVKLKYGSNSLVKRIIIQ